MRAQGSGAVRRGVGRTAPIQMPIARYLADEGRGLSRATRTGTDRTSAHLQS